MIIATQSTFFITMSGNRLEMVTVVGYRFFREMTVMNHDMTQLVHMKVKFDYEDHVYKEMVETVKEHGNVVYYSDGHIGTVYDADRYGVPLFGYAEINSSPYEFVIKKILKEANQ